jgi:hypothetical protein
MRGVERSPKLSKVLASAAGMLADEAKRNL